MAYIFSLHPFAQNKLVRVTKGKIMDVAVDIRRDSPTFGKHYFNASEKNKNQLFIPRGFAHGFVVLSDSAILSYKVDAYYSPEHSQGIAYNDKEIRIDWGFSEDEIILSSADQNYPSLNNSDQLF